MLLQVLFFIIGFAIFLPILFFKSFLLRLSILIYAYPIWVLTGLYLGIPATRIISNVGMNFYSGYIGIGFYAALGSYIAFLLAIWSIRKNEFNFVRIPFPFPLRLLCLLMFILSLFIAYPGVWGLSDGRFGAGGSLVIILFSLTSLARKNTFKIDYINIVMFILILFMLANGERVDFILALSALFMINKKQTQFSTTRLVGVVVVFLFVGVYGGLSRAGGDITFEQLLLSVSFAITNFGTAVDVVHVYMSSVWYFYTKSADIMPFVNLLASYIPLSPLGGAGSEFNFSWALRKHIDNVGGGLFYSVGMMMAGPAGVVVFGYVYGYLFKKLFLLKSYFSVVFIAFFVQQFRIQWYGATYFGTVLFILVFMGVFLYFLKKKGGITAKVKSVR
ncbi:hypothetical protein H4J45_15690 [Colwellia sp. BRX10-6]|uniref:hypothetical protein n=1 Tax=unclassified Colwellia TaxID=196834 RepID=UPI0015F53E6C|nr:MULTISPECIES: hypothetical protein [unclassified Colwellia]MBA6384456.1 hypothetical protein [Colwellia sp. BRX10-9]MBA6395528.1 hypothetical protein [Colwellia sp. BRX10-6]